MTEDIRSDEALYQGVCEGRMGDYERLYVRYESRLFCFILSRLKNREEAEEVFQEAMLRILKPANLQFQAGGFSAWLHKVAWNLCLNRIRARRRSDLGLSEFGKESEMAARGRPADELCISREKEKALKLAMIGMTNGFREVYELRASGKSYHEVAEVLQMPVGTVKSRMNGLVAHLRKEMSKWNVK